MILMKNLIKNESAIMNPIISFILSMAVIVIMFYMFSPMLWFITNILIEMGAPAATALFYMKMFNWGMVLFAIGALLILISKVYRKTHDTGIQRVY